MHLNEGVSVGAVSITPTKSDEHWPNTLFKPISAQQDSYPQGNGSIAGNFNELLDALRCYLTFSKALAPSRCFCRTGKTCAA